MIDDVLRVEILEHLIESGMDRESAEIVAADLADMGFLGT